MRKYAVVAVLLASTLGVGAQPAPAPAKSFTLSVTTEEANLILEQLAAMPWKTANPTLQKLLGQLQQQQQAPAVAPPTPPEPPK